MVIAHIIGPSGSGKTSLGLKLAQLPNTIVLDTDDIDDKNVIKLLSKYNIDIKKEDTALGKELKAANKQEIEKIINNVIAGTPEKHIILVGYAFIGMNIIPNIATHKFSIKIDPDTLYRQYHLRTLAAITENASEIKRLLENKKNSIDNIDALLIKKYKIRSGFASRNKDGIIRYIKLHNTDARKDKYKIMYSDEIYTLLKGLIK
jgi:shikimate kinase